jgi:hypothetical protein
LFDASHLVLDAFHTSYDVTPDGRYFIFAAPRELSGAPATQVVQVEHWFSDVRTRLAK